MFKEMWKQIRRVIPLLVIVLLAIIIFGDVSQLSVQLYKLSMVAMVIGAFNIARQSLFPYIDLRLVYLLARKEPLGAAIIFASVIAFLITIIVVAVV